ncbi:MAG: S8 family serine peptidase [Pyrinomonadaceae bacterium]|nr:S8 family serine peptidase [Pyrinomonadaceae bacterium]
MNRNNYVGHIVLALTLVMLAGLAGQIRRWHKDADKGLLVVRQSTKQRACQLRGVVGRGGSNFEGETDVIVRFRPGTTAEAMTRIAARFNDRVEDRFEYINDYAAINDNDGLDAETIAAEYRSLPEVADAEPNITISLDPPLRRYIGRFTEEDASNEMRSRIEGEGNFNYVGASEPNDPMFSDQWSLANTGQRDGRKGADIGALEAWEKTKGSRDVVVAVLDSGVDYTHPDLAGNMWKRPDAIAAYADKELGAINDMHGYNAVDNSGDPMDDNGHGTHCAGIVGAEGDNGQGIAGVNWNVQIMPLKFMSKGGFGTTKAAIEAINYVIDRKRAGVGVRIISASWGSTVKSRALETAIKRAGEEGILFVAAAGNASANADRSPHYPASYRLPNVLSVAALNRNDELAGFSNYGAKTVHVAAPGAEILSTWLGADYLEASGTSMATPEVSGIAALVLATDENLTVEELRERLMNSVDKLDSLQGRTVSGGRINARRAVTGE